jgi:hypothetical protein
MIAHQALSWIEMFFIEKSYGFIQSNKHASKQRSTAIKSDGIALNSFWRSYRFRWSVEISRVTSARWGTNEYRCQ